MNMDFIFSWGMITVLRYFCNVAVGDVGSAQKTGMSGIIYSV